MWDVSILAFSVVAAFCECLRHFGIAVFGTFFWFRLKNSAHHPLKSSEQVTVSKKPEFAVKSLHF